SCLVENGSSPHWPARPRCTSQAIASSNIASTASASVGEPGRNRSSITDPVVPRGDRQALLSSGMTPLSQTLARRMQLIEPRTLEVICERDLRIPMDDGAALLADRWVARADRDRPQPTVL